MNSIDDNGQLDDCQQLTTTTDCVSPSKSRYGRTRRPKIVQDFYNLDHVVIDEKFDNYDAIPVKSSSPRKQFDIRKDKVIRHNFDIKIADDFKTNQPVEKPDNDDNDVTKVIKLITTPPIITDSLEKSNKLLKTYTNKRKQFCENNCKVIESFGLPDEPIIPITTTPINKNLNGLKLKIELPDLYYDDANCRRNTRSVSKNLQEKIVETNLEVEKFVENSSNFKENALISQKIENGKISPIKIQKNQRNSVNSPPQRSSLRLNPNSCTTNQSNTNLEHFEASSLESSQNLDNLDEKTIINDNNNNDDDKKMIEHKIGDLIWAKMGAHPYWPCLITVDPKFQTHLRYFVRCKTPYYHVRFFADNGRRSWVNLKFLLPYYGKDDLEKMHKTLINQNDPRCDDFVVKPKKLPTWTCGVEEAESLLPKTVEERLQFFEQIILKDQQKRVRNSLNFNKKKRTNNDSIGRQTKRLKRDSRNSINSTTTTTIEENPIEKIDDSIGNKSIPHTMDEQELLYRRNNIFRGVSREKVCQICEKSGNVLKCKGPCNGNYHVNCLNQMNEAQNNVDDDMSLSEKIDLKMKEIMKKVEQNDSITKHVTADSVSYLRSNAATKTEEFRCNYCRFNKIPPCIVCSNDNSNINNNLNDKLPIKCSLYNCGQFYHLNCLKLWPQTQWTSIYSKIDSFVCPRHVCHTCCSDDPETVNSRSNGKLVKCLYCPTTYHTANYCVPAGTIILSTTQIICPRHSNDHHDNDKKRNKFNQTVNANWCFICSRGGDLICCETCPTSVHIECLPPTSFNNGGGGGGDDDDVYNNDTFFCEDCQSGRLPLYDEIVWVKLGKFRWWPAIILFPNEIPKNVKHVQHNRNEFVVKFFGTYDHYWVGRGRTFLFQEGDNKGRANTTKRRVDNAFNRAVEEAIIAHNLKKEFRVNIMAEKNSALKPPHYIRIKANKPVGNVRQFDGNTSNTTSCNCDPNQEYPCGPDTDCLNRLLLIECNPDMCSAGERCNNQCFEKRQYPPLIPHKTQTKGWGLKTLAPIRKGQFIIEYVGEMIDENEYKRRIERMHQQKDENYYFLTIDNYRMLDAGPKGNVARFMNHSCQPNCETQKWTVNGDTRVGLFATCDIPAGTELTFNYNLVCIGEEKKVCNCGASNCSGFIGVKAKTEEATNESKKVRRKKRSRKKKIPQPKIEPVEESLCFICRQNGDVYACNNKICTKFYHLDCVGLEAWPDGGKWTCSWHNCNICSKRTIRCCFDCINSYCPSHSDGNVRYDKFLGFVCKQHDPIINNNCKELAKNEIKLAENLENTAENIDETVSPLKDESVIDLVEISNKINHNLNKTPSKKRKRSENEQQTQRFTRSNSGFLLQDIDQTIPIRKRTRLRCET